MLPFLSSATRAGGALVWLFIWLWRRVYTFALGRAFSSSDGSAPRARRGAREPLQRCRMLSTVRSESMELSALPLHASWISSRLAGVSTGWIALSGGLHCLQAGLVL